MNTRFQVFVSSTQRDLREEREHVINELTRIGYIAVGMEQFPATDEEQFEYIQRIIDDSDYYVIIVKGRYGSESSTGVSYTEKEFDYAVSTHKPALAFIFSDLEKLRIEETDNDPVKMIKLLAFRKRLEENRIVRYWTLKDELVSSIKNSVNDIARRRPGVGWIRGNQAVDPTIYKDIEALRKENVELRNRVDEAETAEIAFPSHLSQGEDEFEFEIVIKRREQHDRNSKEIEIHRTKISLSWNVIYQILILIVYNEPREVAIQSHLQMVIAKQLDLPKGQYLTISQQAISMIGHQFEALGLFRIISVPTNFGNPRVWEITEKGRRLVAQLKAIRRNGDLENLGLNSSGLSHISVNPF